MALHIYKGYFNILLMLLHGHHGCNPNGLHVPQVQTNYERQSLYFRRTISYSYML